VLGTDADDHRTEVPINEYPTKESFAGALAGFGAMVDEVNLLAAIGDGSEAMLLYDMHVRQLGTMRIAEHFTVNAGQITRLRQIHDTVPMRQAGLGPVTANAEPTGYAGSVTSAATCEQAVAALTTLDGLREWWTPSVTGTPQPGGELRFRFEGVDELIRMHVDAITSSHTVTWTCLEHTSDPDWTDSTVSFKLTATATGCNLSLTHSGIAPDRVHAGWETFLSSIADYVETGTGRPYKNRDGTGSHP
jgi:uncharacterized protein YndB with AHSA1/START domain